MNKKSEVRPNGPNIGNLRCPSCGNTKNFLVKTDLRFETDGNGYVGVCSAEFSGLSTCICQNCEREGALNTFQPRSSRKNRKRAPGTKAALSAYGYENKRSEAPRAELARDLIVDLLHFLDGCGEDCEQVLRSSRTHWLAER